ncbi:MULTISPECIES: helix-turn-helix domain-containing protein [Burkholderia cepacia complex]|uniref:ImmA/IrrE family metallo-endopeptidase n=3 Tax=Burkholderia cepacia complex TaxID=87882 RepID=A0A6H9TWB9_9BURK|nr:XRE family transcriptional regulator [Burkholderia cenocepacia]KAB0644543.1 ImmA/IrrE family metallo-endopeptidase [Burkholderia latens]HDR9879696.1 ImmA/IrrE family metallo-endopeptidase [Burkholderia cenocepacia]HDR9886785.1 ImmA/IrrE family metallo-endopeptidase [Burkholderia cenocepacia]
MSTHEHILQDSARRMGARIRAARESAGMTQAQLSEALGFADRQTLSTIENGDRRVQAAELVRASQVLGHAIDWFIDPFVVTGEARFSWRVAQTVPDALLDEFESRIGQLVGLMRHLKVALHGPSRALTPMLRIPPHPTFEDAWAWGEAVAQELELGTIPSEKLVDHIERKLDISVLFIDAEVAMDPKDISGAMCRLSDLGVIVINRQESTVRRNFDVAHELFHALTWDAMPPDRRDPSDQPAGKRVPRIEQLADNFAAAVLMPKATLDKLIPQEHLTDAAYLASVARELQVSTGALAYRLLNAKMIDKSICDALREVYTPKARTEMPKLLSASFATLLHDGIAHGHVSARKAAKALSMRLDQLAELMTEHGKAVPFSM